MAADIVVDHSEPRATVAGARSLSVIETVRLTLRQLDPDDSGFIVELLNDPSFIRFVGDRGVRTVDDAGRYISDGPVASYARHGFGLWLVQRKDSGAPIGICGLLKRDSLPDVDIGFAFLPPFRAEGYAYESAAAVLAYGAAHCGLTRVAAVVNAENVASIKLLEKLGMQYERMVRLSDTAPEIRLYAVEVGR
jgi:RimJ/RimL family protein N-acetyltransferase